MKHRSKFTFVANLIAGFPADRLLMVTLSLNGSLIFFGTLSAGTAGMLR
jgi:hypothetical protein